MGLVTKNFTFSTGNTIVASEINTNYDTLYDLVNGEIENTNIKSSAAIANTKLANPNAFFTMAFTAEGQHSSTIDPLFTFQMPFAATLVEVSACARDLDVAGTNAYVIDLEEAGTTVLSTTVALTADNTPVVGVISDSALADNAKMEIVMTLSGDTSPTIDDLTVLLTFKVGHTT